MINIKTNITRHWGLVRNKKLSTIFIKKVVLYFLKGGHDDAAYSCYALTSLFLVINLRYFRLVALAMAIFTSICLKCGECLT